MRKYLIGFALLAFSSVSQAALTSCVAPGPTFEASLISGGIVGADVTFTCSASGVPLDGVFINGVLLQISGAFSDANAAPGVYSLNVSVVGNTDAGGTVGLNGLNCTATGTSVVIGAAGLCNSSSGFIAIAPVDQLSAFTVTVHATSPALAGQLVPFSGSTSLSFDVSTTRDTGGNVPEPSTLAMMGSSLIGLGLVARKRRSNT